MNTKPVRVILFMGKGGVGKTTIAAGSAVLAAEAGERVVVTSTDPAHSLGDVLGQTIGSTPVQVTPGCHAQQLSGRERLEESWAEVGGWLRRAFAWAGLDALEAQELTLLPGLEELFALAEVASLVDSQRFDTVMVDCAPTAETLRLLTLPEVLGFYLDRFDSRSLRQSAGRVAHDALRRFGDLPLADAQVARVARRLTNELTGVNSLLSSESTSTRLVLTPERVVVAEARRTQTALSLHGYNNDAVIVNRLLPDGLTDEFTVNLRQAQLARLDDIRSGFGGVDMMVAEMSPTEPIGVTAVTELARRLYSGRTPSDMLGLSQQLAVLTGADGPELHLPLPNVDQGEVDLWAGDDEVHVTVGAHRRNLMLPGALAGHAVTGASFDEDVLVIRFAP